MTERVTWLGHATVLIEVGGARLLTDPVLRPRVAHLRRHAPLPGVPGDLDAVLLSHAHRDHRDAPTLRRIGAAVPVLGPGMAPGDERAVGGATVTAVPAVHGRIDAVGFVAAGARRVYFAGDTEPFDAMSDLGPIDVALLPVWGWGTSLGPGHMDPEQAARAAAAIAPRVAIPIHWGTYLPVGAARKHAGLLATPGRAFADALAEHAPGTRAVVLEPGGALDL